MSLNETLPNICQKNKVSQYFLLNKFVWRTATFWWIFQLVPFLFFVSLVLTQTRSISFDLSNQYLSKWKRLCTVHPDVVEWKIGSEGKKRKPVICNPLVLYLVTFRYSELQMGVELSSWQPAAKHKRAVKEGGSTKEPNTRENPPSGIRQFSLEHLGT